MMDQKPLADGNLPIISLLARHCSLLTNNLPSNRFRLSHSPKVYPQKFSTYNNIKMKSYKKSSKLKIIICHRLPF